MTLDGRIILLRVEFWICRFWCDEAFVERHDHQRGPSDSPAWKESLQTVRDLRLGRKI